MNADSDLKAIERKAFRVFFNDGLLEIFIGILLLCMMAGDALTEVGANDRWIYLWMAALILAFIWVKKRIIRPRIGQVVFGAKRRSNRRKLLTLIILIQAFTLVILGVVWTGKFPAAMTAGTGAFARQVLAGFLFFTVPFGAMAWFLENPWMLVPAILGFYKEALRGVLPNLWITVATCGVGGAILVIAGTVFLVRFLRRYPIPRQEA
jgi:hypothetical protein